MQDAEVGARERARAAGRGQRPRSIVRSGAGEKVSDSEGSGRGGGETILSLPPVHRIGYQKVRAEPGRVVDCQKLVSVSLFCRCPR